MITGVRPRLLLPGRGCSLAACTWGILFLFAPLLRGALACIKIKPGVVYRVIRGRFAFFVVCGVSLRSNKLHLWNTSQAARDKRIAR